MLLFELHLLPVAKISQTPTQVFVQADLAYSEADICFLALGISFLFQALRSITNSSEKTLHTKRELRHHIIREDRQTERFVGGSFSGSHLDKHHRSSSNASTDTYERDFGRYILKHFIKKGYLACLI